MDDINKASPPETANKSAAGKVSPHPGIYLLPNLLTTGALFAGFYAVVAAMKGLFIIASVAIFIAMIMDGLDGRVARLTNTQSEFGTEYDSLSDIVAFGIAPALVAYAWTLSQLGKPGWLAAFIYTASAALRLARFNTQTGTSDKRYFRGLAVPAAAALVTSIVWCGQHFDFTLQEHPWLMSIVMVLAAGLMVSNFPYYSFKTIDLSGRLPFVAGGLVVVGFVGIAMNPPLVLCLGFVAYAISAPFWAIVQRIRKRKFTRATFLLKKRAKKDKDKE